MRKIILASNSPRRKQILEQTGLKFSVDVSDFNEDVLEFSNPHEMVERLSLEKAKIVAKRNPKALIIAADTTVFLNNEIIGKPKSKTDAFRILKLLSGNKHQVITGFTIIEGKKIITKHVISEVVFKNLSDEQINAYIATDEPMDKAGGYGIQDNAGVFVDRVIGDYNNIVGFPLVAILDVLKEFGIDTLKTYEK